MDENDLPYVVEYAKSNRSSCKKCKSNIGKDVLRIGVLVQSPHFDGKVPNWHHVSCFFSKWALKSTGEIKHFSSLRYEDQKMLEGKVGVPAGNPGTKSKKGSKKSNLIDPEVADFSVEYAKSNRSECKVCIEKIAKGEIRISKLEIDSDKAKRFGPLPGWRHVDCFVKVKGSLGYTKSGDSLPGFSTLTAEDQDLLKEKIKAIPTDKKRKLPDATEEAVPKKVAKTEDSKNDVALKNQSKLIYSFRDKLQKNLTKKQLMELLEANDQTPPSGESLQLDILADCLSFGALKPCPECQGQLKIASYDYKCTGNLTSWTKCQFRVTTPKRTKFIVPEDYAEDFSFLKSYKYVKRDRIFPPKPEMPSSESKGPLENFRIFLLGKLKDGQAVATQKVNDLGGKTAKQISETVTCIVTTKEECDKNAKKMRDAERHNVFVVAEEFLDEAKNGGAALLIKKYMIKSWGGDPVTKLCSMTTKFSKSVGVLSAFSSGSKVKTVTVDGKAGVDPDSGMEGMAEVMKHKGEPLNAVLGMVDIQRGTNSYYKLQVLQHISRSKYYLFRSWGRVGTTIGGNKLEDFSTSAEAIKTFNELYLEKTGNEWKDRANFVKYPHRFYPLDIDYGQDAVEKLPELKVGSNSKLALPIQELICLIFNVEAMKKAMMEFDIDLQKMPLGKLSKKQIKAAFSVLSELQKILDGNKNENQILDASNRFYTLIPHDFGMKKPPMLDNLELLKNKTEMLDSLLDMEIAYNLLKTDNTKKADPIDQHYLQLKTTIEILEEETKEFQLISKYLHNTHAGTHNQYRLKIEQVFKIHRDGELDRYRKFKDLHNKKLLWHGSRVTNFAGILSQGLRIAPPEAPVTGYMFGKGIYFADMVSKSANYCFTNRLNPTGLLLLCEVALGNMYELNNAKNVETLPNNLHSTKGLGATGPDPSESVTQEGIEIPLGKPIKIPGTGSRSLLYNEYIVYDIEQVNIKYLLRVNFGWT